MLFTSEAIIQYKDGASRGSAVADQILNKTEPFVDKPFVGFVNSQTPKGDVTVRRAGR